MWLANSNSLCIEILWCWLKHRRSQTCATAWISNDGGCWMIVVLAWRHAIITHFKTGLTWTFDLCGQSPTIWTNELVVWNCRNSLREHLNGLPYLQCLCRKSEDLYKYYNDKQRIAQRPNPPKNKNGKNPHRSHDASLFASFFRRSNPQRLPVVMNLWIECQKHWAKRGEISMEWRCGTLTMLWWGFLLASPNDLNSAHVSLSTSKATDFKGDLIHDCPGSKVAMNVSHLVDMGISP